MKRLFITAIAVAAASAVHSAKPVEILDTMRIECRYAFTYSTDTTATDKVKRDDMVLRTSGENSCFLSLATERADSLISTYDLNANDGATLAMALANTDRLRGGENWSVTRNAAGQTTVTAKIVEKYYYTEPTDDIEWSIGEDTATVMSYLCRKATARYNGLLWTVYFTEEIPVAEGPWKLHGLPGLILRAEAAGRFSFEAVALTEIEKPWTGTKSGAKRTTREKMGAMAMQMLRNPLELIQQNGNVRIAKVVDASGREIRPTGEDKVVMYDPILLY